jgi:pimeloyl-ACP methyl ester carboxylesterase
MSTYLAVGIAVVFLALGLAGEAIREHRDHRRFPFKGELVFVGHHRMHLVCTGAGEPAVILEGPQTGVFATWAPVQKAVSGFTQVCSYDRSGFGFSEPGPLPRTSEAIALELQELLRRANVPPPYVLVGASAGGFHVRVYAGRFPAEVAGVVLVDSSHPDQISRLHLPANPTAEFNKWEPLLPLTHGLGILRFGLHREPRPAGFSAADWDEVLFLRNTTNSYRALIQEGDAWAESANQVRASGNLGTKPMLVLTGARDVDASWRAAWVDGLQADLVRISARGKQVVLSNSGHGIQFDAPDDVAKGIHEVWNTVRSTNASGSQ